MHPLLVVLPHVVRLGDDGRVEVQLAELAVEVPAQGEELRGEGGVVLGLPQVGAATNAFHLEDKKCFATLAK